MASPRLWFTPKTVRRIKLRSYAGLVGKAPTKEKRIKMLVTMPITGHKLTGFPEWLAEARDYVMKHGQVVKPAESINYCNVTMRDEASLFQKTPIEAPKAKLSHFTIENEGDSEDPTTVVKFQILAGFSTDLLRWCGQMAGEEFDSIYEITDAPEEQESEDDEGEADADAALAEDPDNEKVRQKKRRDERAAVAKAKENITLM
jgi:hypothetical protein